jgi:phospholipid transport system substrate-binding protein
MTSVTFAQRFTPLLALTLATAAQAQSSEPVAKIGAYNDAVIAIAKAKLPMPARTERFETVVKSYYDMPTIAGLVVGPAWSSASASDKASAIQALTHHSAVSLAKNFASYDGTPMQIDPKPIARAGSQIVKVTIGKDTLFYRMNSAGGGLKIIDVISQGVSQLALQRADLATTVSQGIPAMVKRLGQLDSK